MQFVIIYAFKTICGLPAASKQMDKMTADRVKACAAYAKKESSVLMKIHHSDHITQLNSVPEGSRCAVTGKHLDYTNGVQLVMKDAHICIHTNKMQQWFHYFRIRHFPQYISGLIREWITKQPWYFMNKNIKLSQLTSSHWPDTILNMYKESMEAIKS